MGFQTLSPEEFQKEARNIARQNLVRFLGNETISHDSILPDFLAERYGRLYELRAPPTKTILIDLLSQNSFKPDLETLSEAAQACEFWAGIFFTHIENHPILSLSNFNESLARSYVFLANWAYSFEVSARVANKVLHAFRNATIQLKDQGHKSDIYYLVY